MISAVEQLIADGRELGQFVVDFTWYLRNLMLLKSSDEMSDVLDMSSENLTRLKEEAVQINDEELIRYIRIFSELSNQIKYSSQKRVLLEVTLIKLCRPQMEQDYSAIIQRLEQLEKKMEQGIPVAAVASAQPVMTTNAVAQNETEQNVLPKAVPEDVEQAVKNWRKIVSSMPGVSRSYLSKARLTLGSGNELVLVFEDTMAAGYISRPEEREQLENAIAEHIGKQVAVLVKENDNNRPFEESHVDLEQVIHMEITYEDE